MYVRRNHTSLTPPVNYAGVAFSSELPKQQESSDETKIHKAESSLASDVSAPFKIKNEEFASKAFEDMTKISESEPIEEIQVQEITNVSLSQENERKENVGKEETTGIFSDIFGAQFTFEDILLFASLFLLISGQTDDEILILVGVLLLLCHA